MNKIKLASMAICALVALVSVLTTYAYVKVLYPLEYKREIETAGYINHIDPALIASVINEESSFDNLSESRSGAVGLMQLMPKTAEWIAERMGVEYSREKLYEPLYNINIGTYYLRYLLDKFGDEFTALCAYNAGEGQVKVWLSDSLYALDDGVLTATPFKETNDYASKVINNKYRYATRFESSFKKH